MIGEYFRTTTYEVTSSLSKAPEAALSWLAHSWPELLILFGGLLAANLAHRALGYEKIRTFDTATKGFSPLQHDLVKHLFRDDHPTQILAYDQGLEDSVTFLTSPLGFGVIAVVANPEDPEEQITLLAESPDAILKMLGYPPESYDEALAQRWAYVIDSHNGAQDVRSRLRAALSISLENKVKIDIGATNPIRSETQEGISLNSPLARLDFGLTEDGQYELARLVGTYGQRTLTERPPQPILKSKLFPAGTTAAEAEARAHIRFLETHHANKQELAGLRRRAFLRTLRSLTQYIGINFTEKMKTNLSGIRKIKPHRLLISLVTEGFRYTHPSTVNNGLIKTFLLDGLGYALGIKPPLPSNIATYRSDTSVFFDFQEPIYFATPGTNRFQGWRIQDLREHYPHDPVYMYSDQIDYFANFAAKPAACVATIEEDSVSMRRPCGITAKHTRQNGNRIVYFTYSQDHCVWEEKYKDEWGVHTQPVLAQIKQQDLPPHIEELFGEDHRNSVALIGRTLYIMKPEQRAEFEASKRNLPAAYVQKIGYHKAAKRPATKINPASAFSLPAA